MRVFLSRLAGSASGYLARFSRYIVSEQHRAAMAEAMEVSHYNHEDDQAQIQEHFDRVRREMEEKSLRMKLVEELAATTQDRDIIAEFEEDLRIAEIVEQYNALPIVMRKLNDFASRKNFDPSENE